MASVGPVLKLDQKSLDAALKHIQTWGDTDIFPVVSEFQAITADWEFWSEHLQHKDVRDLVKNLGPLRSAMFPTHSGGFLCATQLDPIETIIVVALVLQFGERIEEFRNSMVEPYTVAVFSYRFERMGDSVAAGHLYQQASNHFAFVLECEKLAAQSDPTTEKPLYEAVLVANICDFYSRIKPSDIVQAVSNLPYRTDNFELKEDLKCFVEVLEYLVQTRWQQSESCKCSGIPVGCDATRLLAELVLHLVDTELQSRLFDIYACRSPDLPRIEVVRFSDSYRVFCPMQSDAILVLHSLCDVLDIHHNLGLQGKLAALTHCDMYLGDKTAIYGLQGYQKTLQARSKYSLAVGKELEEKVRLYHNLKIKHLDEKAKVALTALNLNECLVEELNKPTWQRDHELLDFVLRFLSVSDDYRSVQIVIDNIGSLYPCIRGLASYLKRAPAEYRSAIGKYLCENLMNGYGTSIHQRVHYLDVLSVDPDGFTASFASGVLVDCIMEKITILDFLTKVASKHSFATEKFTYASLCRFVAKCAPTDGVRQWVKSQRLLIAEAGVNDWIVRSYICALKVLLPGDIELCWNSLHRENDPLCASLIKWVKDGAKDQFEV